MSDAGDPRFQQIVRLGARLTDASVGAVLSLEGPAPVLTCAVGLAGPDWPLASAYARFHPGCSDPFFSGDLSKDPAARGWGPSALGIGFFAAVPIAPAEGRPPSALLCFADPRPRQSPDRSQQQALADLAALAADLIARDRNVRELQESQALERQRMELALSAAGLAAYDWDAADDTALLSERVRGMIGVEGGAIPANGGEALFARVHPDDRERAREAVLEGLAQQGRYEVEHRIVRPSDGQVVWLASSGVRVRSRDGETHKVIGIAQDITARKLADEQRETLVAELDHRIKNVLAAVQSLALQSARRAGSLEGFLKTFTGRLKAMASAQQLLTATRWRGAGMRNIAAAELGGLAPGQTRWEGPDVMLTPRAANAMSLALHELATNAIKFGALSVDAGRVSVQWRIKADGGLELHWHESEGPLVAIPTRHGFGSTLLEKVTGRELGGDAKVEYRREGVRAVLTAAASALAEPVAETVETPPEPVAEPGGAATGVRYEQAAKITGLRLLIVEDALLLTLELEAGLQEAGAEIVGSAADVDEAMRMVDLPIDAAVLDANLNGASVLPVAEALAARGIPFVFATGYGDSKMAPQGFGAPIIRKPYDVTQVAAALAEITGRA